MNDVEQWHRRNEETNKAANPDAEQQNTPAEPQPEQPEHNQPVAYDANGRPLYAAPQSPSQSNAAPQAPTQYVHMTRAVEPERVEVSPEVKRRHEESKKAFPDLNLSEHEYIISVVRRHPIGMIGPLIATGLSVALMMILIMNYMYFAELLNLPHSSFGWVLLIGVLMIVLFLIGGYLAVWVFTSNRFILTNESVIQEIQASLFSKKEQTVSLLNIEDASYDQDGPLQAMLNYGRIRLSTEGEETTYRFDFVANPKEEIAVLNNAVEAFKNGRPVDPPVEALAKTRSKRQHF